MLRIRTAEDPVPPEAERHCIVCCDTANPPVFVIEGPVGGMFDGSRLANQDRIDELMHGAHEGEDTNYLCNNAQRHWLAKVFVLAPTGDCPHCATVPNRGVGRISDLRLIIPRPSAAGGMRNIAMLVFGRYHTLHAEFYVDHYQRHSQQGAADTLEDREASVDRMSTTRNVYPAATVESASDAPSDAKWIRGGLGAEVAAVLDNCQRVIARGPTEATIGVLDTPEKIRTAIENHKFLPYAISGSEGMMLITGVYLPNVRGHGPDMGPLRENVRYQREELARIERDLWSSITTLEAAERQPRHTMASLLDEVLAWPSVLRVSSENPFKGKPSIMFRPVVLQAPRNGPTASKLVHYIVTTPVSMSLDNRNVKTRAHPHCTSLHTVCWGLWATARDRTLNDIVQSARTVESWRLGVDWSNSYMSPQNIGSEAMSSYLEHMGDYRIVQCGWNGELVELAALHDARKEETHAPLLLPTAF